MKRSLRNSLFYGLILLVLFCLPLITRAQCPDAGFDPGCDPVTCTRADGSYCPIDNNVYLLLAVGVFYGFKKIRERKKVTAEEISQK